MSTFKKNERGYWTRNGKELKNVVEVRPDKCLCSPLVREMFHPHSLIVYFPETVFMENDEVTEQVICFVCGAEIWPEKGEIVPVPLCLLDFSKRQKEKLIKYYQAPKEAFDKISVPHVERFSPKTLQEEISEIESEHLLEYAIIS